MPNTEPSLNVIIDHLVPTEIPADTGIFELSTLMSLEMGLNHIALTVWQKEEPLRGKNDTRMRAVHHGTDPRETRLLESQFHWFGVSLCNYVSLVGFLASLNSGEVGREDLQNTRGRKRIASACKAYVNGVPEIRDVLMWRNTIAGHFTITDSRNDDSVITLDMAPLHPISFMAHRYHVSSGIRGRAHQGHVSMSFPCGQLRKCMSAWRRDIGHRFDGQRANTTRVVAYPPGNSKVRSVLSRSAESEALRNDTI